MNDKIHIYLIMMRQYKKTMFLFLVHLLCAGRGSDLNWEILSICISNLHTPLCFVLCIQYGRSNTNMRGMAKYLWQNIVSVQSLNSTTTIGTSLPKANYLARNIYVGELCDCTTLVLTALFFFCPQFSFVTRICIICVIELIGW